jgi:PPE-repeat protein
MPPETNSGRIYAGTGPGPLMAAAASWQAIAAELSLNAGSFGGVTGELAGTSWLGPSSESMTASALPFIQWMLLAAGQAEHRAMAATSMAGAYEAAFAGVISPEQITENRTRLATLISTNFMGVNSGAIAEAEAEYSEFWAQDATTLYAYTATVQALVESMNADPFLPSMPTVDPAGAAGEAASVGEAAGQSAGQSASTVSGATSSMSGMSSAMGGLSPLTQGASSLGQVGGQLVQPASQMLGQIPQLLGSFMNPAAANGALTGFSSSPLSSGLNAARGVTASMGGGMRLPSATLMPGGGTSPRLSVPTTWAGAVDREGAAARGSAATALTEEESQSATVIPRGGIGGMPLTAMGAGNQGGNQVARSKSPYYPPRLKVVNEWAGGG